MPFTRLRKMAHSNWNFISELCIKIYATQSTSILYLHLKFKFNGIKPKGFCHFNICWVGTYSDLQITELKHVKPLPNSLKVSKVKQNFKEWTLIGRHCSVWKLWMGTRYTPDGKSLIIETLPKNGIYLWQRMTGISPQAI